jgi:hypothetical protein
MHLRYNVAWNASISARLIPILHCYHRNVITEITDYGPTPRTTTPRTISGPSGVELAQRVSDPIAPRLLRSIYIIKVAKGHTCRSTN